MTAPPGDFPFRFEFNTFDLPKGAACKNCESADVSICAGGVRNVPESTWLLFGCRACGLEFKLTGLDAAVLYKAIKDAEPMKSYSPDMN